MNNSFDRFLEITHTVGFFLGIRQEQVFEWNSKRIQIPKKKD